MVGDIRCGTTIGNNKVVWFIGYYSKTYHHNYLFITIDDKGRFRICKSDRGRALDELQSRYDTLPKAVRAAIEIMKNECKTKHINK